MTISQPYINVLTREYTTTVAITSAVFTPHLAAQQTNFFILADTDGTADVEVQLSDGSWTVISASVATSADDLTYVNINMAVRAARVLFTPSAAPGTVVIDASYTGHAQPS